MPVHSFDESWSWVQFVCAFSFAGLVAFLKIGPLSGALGGHLVQTFVIAAACGWVAGRYGDSVWRRMVTLLGHL